MLIGTMSHLAWIIKNGFLSVNYNAPLFSKFFWDALTFVDPIADIMKQPAAVRDTILIIVRL